MFRVGGEAKSFEAALKKAGVAFGRAGRVIREPLLAISTHDPKGGRKAGPDAVNIATSKLREAWRTALHLSEPLHPGEGVAK